MIVCFDLETTGLDKAHDRIIEISMVKFDENTFEVVDRFDSFVDPEIAIPELISGITNIYDDDVNWAPKIEELRKEILEFVGNAPLLWHNVYFDRDFYIASGIDVRDNIILDTFFLANFLASHSPSLNLEVLAKRYWVAFSGAHRAVNDVEATINLFKCLLDQFKKQSTLKKELLFFVFDRSEDKNILFLKDLLFPENNKSIDIDSFEKKILKKLKKVSPTIKKEQDLKNIPELETLFENLWSVEKRENQLKMTSRVYRAFDEKQKLVIEAPTWLGKSFAYLIPSIIHALKNDTKVFVSTKTKNLQDQLYLKDLSFLSEKLGYDFSYAKLKWKKNYLSIGAYFHEVFQEDLSYTKVSFLLKITLWLLETTYGELDELNFFGQEFSFLKLMNADVARTLNDVSKYRNFEFLVKARNQVETSDLVVINHSLLFSDLKWDSSVLWDIENLVIDEAHNIEDTLTDSLKQRYNLLYVSEQLDTIESILTKKKIAKIEFLKQKEALLSRLDIIEEYATDYLHQNANMGNNYISHLVKDDFFEDINFSDILKKIELSIMDIVDNLWKTSEFDFWKESSFLESMLTILKDFMDITSSNKFIKLINFNDRNWLSLEYTLLNPWNYLAENLWKQVDSVILTSATLQIGWTFDYISQILSLDNFEFSQFDSDFNYKKQSTLFIPTDLGNIKNNSQDIIWFLWNFYKVVRGKTLTLLTSFSMIKSIYNGTQKELKQEGINLYAQSIAWSKSKLMQFYLEDSSNSILLWTDSFWEWVDIPWEDLKYLIIHKFPFSVPTDPIFQARSVFFQDPFKEYSIPKAIIKLKQGFGRLIRSKNDTGIVILLDSRISAPGWGQEFLKAFPDDINIKQGSAQKFINILENR